MEPDRDTLQFYSGDPIDKIVYQNTRQVYNAGPSGPSYGNSDSIVTETIVNPYGKRCMARFRWRVDAEDWQSQDTVLEYSFSIDATALGGPILPADPGCKGAVAMGVSDGNIFFRTNNGHHGNVVYTAGPDVYTPIPHTYTFEYALYEVD